MVGSSGGPMGGPLAKTAANIAIKTALFGRMGRELGRVGSGYKTVQLAPDRFVPKPRPPLPPQQPLFQQIKAVMQQRQQPYGPYGMRPFTGWNKLSGDYTFDAEDCPKCGVSMEGDSYTGTCNSCQHKWGTKKAAAGLTADEGGEDAPAGPGSPMRGWQWKVLQRDQAEAQKAWLPRLFKSDATPLTELLASPAKSGVLGGLAGAGLGE
jgi:hypothetical protein